MAIKCIAIGNRIMGDDSIGIVVLERIASKLQSSNISVILGETDSYYSLSRVDSGDFLFIIDATYYDIEPGKVTFTPLKDIMSRGMSIFSQHEPSFLHELRFSGEDMDGYLIGIEINELRYSLELSGILRNRLSYICEDVSNFIFQFINKNDVGNK
ncbi:MAG TPA: hydrogenase maturation protease [Lachnospiraceae bacterium]|nr:hydrogenase maturation protease [Lachnospiraceae bacterium]